MTKDRAKWACETAKLPKLGCRTALEGRLFQWWWDLGRVGAELKVIWEISVKKEGQ